MECPPLRRDGLSGVGCDPEPDDGEGGGHGGGGGGHGGAAAARPPDVFYVDPPEDDADFDEEALDVEEVEVMALYETVAKLRFALIETISALPLAGNPLDTLIELLGGPDAVAEMTGRPDRLVRGDQLGPNRAGRDW